MKRLLLVLAVLAACNSSKKLAPDSSIDDAAPRDSASLDAAIDAAADASTDPPLPPDPMRALQEMAGLCTSDEWCWAFPTPTGNRYFDIWASSVDNIWMWGGRGTLLQWNGERWISHKPPALPTQEFVRWIWSVHGRSASDMWLIMGSAVEHWNGVTWTIVETGSLNVANPFHNVWAAPNGDVYLSGLFGVKRSQNGGPFMPFYITGGAGGTVWGTAGDDVFLTFGPTIMHYDGIDLVIVHRQDGANFGYYQGVRGDVWASGTNNSLAHWDGTSFTPMTAPTGTSEWMMRGGYRAANDVWWFTGSKFVHWDGSTMTAAQIDLTSYGEFCCIGGSAAQIIGDRWWLVGSDGAVYTKVGLNAFQPVIEPMLLGSSLWGTADNDMYAGQGIELRHWDGHTWTRLASPVGSITGLKGGGLGGTNELWGLGFTIDFVPYEYVYTVYHFDGLTWSGTAVSRTPVSLTAPDTPDHWAVSMIYPLRSGEAMVVAQKGHAFHVKNGVWTEVNTGTTQDLCCVWGPDPDHLWITGDAGTLLHWSSSAPTVMTPDPTLPPTTDNLGSISGAGGSVWIANRYTTYTTLVRRFTSSGWSVVDANLQPQQLAALSDNNVLATSFDNGHIARWNGTEFVIEDYGYETSMYSMFTPPGGHTWLTNGSGIMWHP